MVDPYEIATWRFEQIAPLIGTQLTPSEKRQARRELLSKPVLWPLTGTRARRGLPAIEKRITSSSLDRWIKAFEGEGYDGLLPVPRRDRGTPRHSGITSWIAYAIGLLYEQPERSLTQLEAYLRLEFADYKLSKATLARHLKTHPAFGGIKTARSGKSKRLRGRYEASYAHECWQLDGKGPFLVRLEGAKGSRKVHVLSVIDDYSRAILATEVATSEDTEAAIAVFQKAAARHGIAERMQFDRGSAFDSNAFRGGLAQLGVHRNKVKVRDPETQGKIESYHRVLGRWFIEELRAQVVVDLVHLQHLLDATIALMYQRHVHRITKAAPEDRLAGKISERRVSMSDLARAFFLPHSAKSHPKTGEVRLPNGCFRVPRPFAGHRSRFRYDPIREAAVLFAANGKEIPLEPFLTKPLPPASPPNRRGEGQLQKLLDVFHGKERPNASPGFGLPEVFRELGKLIDRIVPASEQDARAVLDFYQKYGPLDRMAFTQACRRTQDAIGSKRPLQACLDHLARQIEADRDQPPCPSAH